MADDGSARRVYAVYLHAVCLVTLLVLLVSAATAVFAVVRIAAPGTTARGAFGGLPFLGSVSGVLGGAERDRGIVQLAQGALLAIGAGLLFAVHWRWAEAMSRQDAEAAAAAKPAPRRRAPTRKTISP